MFSSKNSRSPNKLQKMRSVYTTIDGTKRRIIQQEDGQFTTVSCKMDPVKHLTSSLIKKLKSIGAHSNIVHRVRKAVKYRENSRNNDREPMLPLQPPVNYAAPALGIASRQNIESFYETEADEIDSYTLYPEDSLSVASTFTLDIPNERLPLGLRVVNPTPEYQQDASDDLSLQIHTTSGLEYSDERLPRDLRVMSPPPEYQKSVSNEVSTGIHTTFTLGIPDEHLPPGLRVMNQSPQEEQDAVDQQFIGFEGGPYYTSDGDEESAFARCSDRLRNDSALGERVWWIV